MDRLIENSLFIRALRREPIPRTPVWFMRQAGRYLPEYRAIRSKIKSFMTLCKTPELALEVTLQPIQRFSLDAAILFSDILTIPDAMGLGLEFVEGEGPRFANPVQTKKAIKALVKPDVEEKLAYVTDAVRLIRRELDKNIPLIGFSGSPWTLACYMVEGQSSKDFAKIRKMVAKEPESIKLLLQLLAESVSDYLIAQIKAGVNTIMIFDTWGGLLGTQEYIQYSLNYMQIIVKNIKASHQDIPLILFTKNGAHWLKEMADTGTDALSLDWTSDLRVARALVGDKVALQGNLNPAILLEDKETIKSEVAAVLEAYGHGSGHIFNLGHGITPDVPPEHVAIMVEAVRELSLKFHGFN